MSIKNDVEKLDFVVPTYAMWNTNRKGEQHLRPEDH